MKQLFTTLTLLLFTAFTSGAQSNGGHYDYIYRYPVKIIEPTRYSVLAECYGGMIGTFSYDIRPIVMWNPLSSVLEDLKEIEIYFHILNNSGMDCNEISGKSANIKMTFDNGADISFTTEVGASALFPDRVALGLQPETEQLSLLATHDIVSWTMNGHTIPIYTPTAGMFAAMFKELFELEDYSKDIEMCDARPDYQIFGRHHLCMTVRPKDATDDSNLMILHPDQWRRLKNKERYEKQTIIIHDEDKDTFVLLDYYDKYDVCGYLDWHTALERFGDRLPTLAAAGLINKCSELRDAARAFGANNYGNFYWTSTSCNESDNKEAYVFCPGKSDVPIERQNKIAPSNTGVLLVDTVNDFVYKLYFADTVELWKEMQRK